MVAEITENCKEEVKLYNKFGDYVGIAFVHAMGENKNQCLIVESNEKINPAEYITDIFKYLRSFLISKPQIHVYLDLSNYYGIANSSWLYEWIFRIKDAYLLETDFIRIDNWLKISNKEDVNILKDYLLVKFKKH